MPYAQQKEKERERKRERERVSQLLDALYSVLTPRNPIKALGGLLSPGTLTGPQVRERERERERKKEDGVRHPHAPGKKKTADRERGA